MAFKTAIIGLGIMGQRMLEHMTLHPEFVVNTIWDPDTAACQAAWKLAPNSALSDKTSLRRAGWSRSLSV